MRSTIELLVEYSYHQWLELGARCSAFVLGVVAEYSRLSATRRFRHQFSHVGAKSLKLLYTYAWFVGINLKCAAVLLDDAWTGWTLMLSSVCIEFVIPAQAGIQERASNLSIAKLPWIPAYAGMTNQKPTKLSCQAKNKETNNVYPDSKWHRGECLA